MIRMTNESFNNLLTHVENCTHLRFFVQAGEIVVYEEDSIYASEIEEWQNKTPRPECPSEIIDVIPYTDGPTKLVVYEDGGLICGYAADAPVEIVEVNWDKNDRANYHDENANGDAQVLLTFIGSLKGEAAIMPVDEATIDAKQVNCIHALAHANYDNMNEDEE